ncbi:MAG: MBL fold metallo-hydrolase [Candidatus Thermoplasmatota archaeon]
MKAKFLGGGDEVGRTGLLIRLGEKDLLFEYGFAASRPPKYPMEAPKPDYTFITHSHLDHSGMVPWLCSNYGVNIFATSPTIAITDLLTIDSYKIAKNEGYIIPFDIEDIKIARSCYTNIKYNQELEFKGFKVKVHPAGHIPGAAMFEVSYDSKKILFTGDINTIDTNLVKGAKEVECDTLIMEATYGGREHPERKNIEKGFIEKIESVIERGGRAIIPAFAVGRTQEILLVLLNEKFNVWLDGMGKIVNSIYLDLPEYIRDVRKLSLAEKRTKMINSRSERERAMKKADVIVTTGGMIEGGPIMSYLMNFRKDKKNCILLTGYQIPGSNGRLLLDEGFVEYMGAKVRVDCEVCFFDFSAHAGHSQLLKFIKGCKPKNVVLFHSETRDAIVQELGNEYNFHLPKNGVEFEVS